MAYFASVGDFTSVYKSLSTHKKHGNLAMLALEKTSVSEIRKRRRTAYTRGNYMAAHPLARPECPGETLIGQKDN